MAGQIIGAIASRAAPQPYGFWGTGSISGTVNNTGTPNTPVIRRVRLHSMDNGVVVAEMWSDASGSYAFQHLAAGTYYVTAFDHTETYNAVIADHLVVA